MNIPPKRAASGWRPRVACRSPKRDTQPHREAVMAGREIEVGAAGGGSVAVPEAGKGPGLALFGAAAEPALAEHYAEEGYVALAAPMAEAAVAALRSRPELQGKIGALGIAVGGHEAAQAAVDVLVIYDPVGTGWGAIAT